VGGWFPTDVPFSVRIYRTPNGTPAYSDPRWNLSYSGGIFGYERSILNAKIPSQAPNLVT
jgi:hypothetical protein